MTFKIPLSAQASLNRIHREGVPALEPVAEGPERRELVTWRGLSAPWTAREKAVVEGLPAAEVAVIHEFKALLGATLTEGGSGESPSLSAASPSKRSGHSEGRENSMSKRLTAGTGH